MRIEKCDICKKEIKNHDDRVSVCLLHPFGQFAFCKKCGEPVHLFLKKKGLANPKND